MRRPRHALAALLALLVACTTDAPLPQDAAAVADAAPDATLALDAATPGGFGMPVALGTTGPTLPEISGIVASRTYEGVFWVENDSGNPPTVFAIDDTGTLLATITLAGATNVDWEDIALGPGASGDDLYVPDFGDNLARTSRGTSGRAGIRLYRLPEPDPALGDRALAAEAIDLVYPAEPHDCEAVFVEPASGDLYLVSKEDSGLAHVFVARAPLAAGPTAVLEELGTLPFVLATAADIRRDGTQIVVRNYAEIRVYDVLASDIAASLASTTYTTARAGSAAEAVCFDANDRDLYTIAEGVGATLFRIPKR